jgi:hypothetical protein
MDNYQKYVKYKTKYLKLKAQMGGSLHVLKGGDCDDDGGDEPANPMEGGVSKNGKSKNTQNSQKK